MAFLPRQLLTPLFAFGGWLAVVPPLLAQPAEPAKFDVLARYRIRTGVNQRIEQFTALTQYLESIGFQRQPGPENQVIDFADERLRGTLPADKVDALLGDGRILAVLLTPAGMAIPDDPAARVLVQLRLDAGFASSQQRDLHRQTAERLRGLGFTEKVGYDHRKYTRLLGTIPSGELPTLVADLRYEPSGWLLPYRPLDTLPQPLQSVSPVQVAEVLLQEGVPALEDVPPATDPGPLQTVSPELRPKVSGEAAEPLRVEVILADEPSPRDLNWRERFPVGCVRFEGIAGRVVTVLATPAQVRDLAISPAVLAIRSPRAALRPTLTPGESPITLTAPSPKAGQGARLVIVDSDFAGYVGLVGKGLPAGTRFVDLTAERNVNVQPEPMPGEAPGPGTLTALAASTLAPAADLTLVRIDGAAPHMLLEVARAIAGESIRTESLRDRRAELVDEGTRLGRTNSQLTRQRIELAENFALEESEQQKRADLEKRQREFSAESLEYEARSRRLDLLESQLLELRRATVVANLLVWQEGQPGFGAGPLTRYLEEVIGAVQSRYPKRGPLVWLQSVGDSRGQAWTGVFADRDGNGVMEFGPLPANAVSGAAERNFLQLRSPSGEVGVELPAGAKLRLVMQWTEPHDADVPPELYRRPVADLRLLMLQQRDPAGKTVGRDDYAVVARSDAIPQCVSRTATAATYEQVLDTTLERAGRYTLRVEGKPPAGIRPVEFPTLPSLQPQWSLTPRLFVEAAEVTGRVQFADFPPDLAGPGIPADSRVIVTVGAADTTGKIANDTARGAMIGQELTQKPSAVIPGDVRLPNGLTARGSAVATGVLAGRIAQGSGTSSALFPGRSNDGRGKFE